MVIIDCYFEKKDEPLMWDILYLIFEELIDNTKLFIHVSRLIKIGLMISCQFCENPWKILKGRKE